MGGGRGDRVLGRRVGIRIGEASDRDGQYFHYLAMWLFALGRIGAVRGGYRERAVALARAIHPGSWFPAWASTGRCSRT